METRGAEPRRRGWRELTCGALAALAAFLLTCHLTAAVALVAPSHEAIDRFVSENLDRTRLPGVAVAVLRRGENVYLGGHGRTSAGEAIGPDTPFRVGSISKSFTAFAVMQLVERGQVELDAPVRRYVPEFHPADPRADAITVRQLLNQTSGMSDAGFHEMSERQPRTLEEAVARLTGARLVASPGSQWNYHNPNYHVLARLVEVVGRRPFSDYMRMEIFEPLGMARTTTVLRARQSALGVADGYVPVYGFPVARSIPDHFVGGSGGVISTARDMSRWLDVHLNGGQTAGGRRLISAESIRLMHSPSGASGDYGFGWETDELPGGVQRVEHGGVLFTFSSNQALYPSLGYGVVALFNIATTTGGEQMSFLEGLNDIVLGQTPSLGLPIGRIVDAGLVLLTLGAAAVGLRNFRRSRRWAARWSQRRWLLTLPRLLVGLMPVALLIALPALAGSAFGGRDVTWTTATFSWPALVIAFVVPAIFATLTLIARLVALRRSAPGYAGARAPGDAPSPVRSRTRPRR